MDSTRLRAAKRGAERALLRIPGVIGVGIGWKYVAGKRTSRMAIRVYVQHKRDVPIEQMIPREIDGMPIDVVQRRVKPMSLAAPLQSIHAGADAGYYDPLRGGISIGSCREIDGSAFTGTLGCRVNDRRTGDPMVLSNYHVLALDPGFTVGDTIVQPSRPDSGACPEDVIGTLSRATIGGAVDAAVATTANRDSKCDIVEIGGVAGAGVADTGMEVRKRGRTTRVTQGSVDATDVSITVPFPGLGSIGFSNQIEVSSGARPIAVAPGLFIAGEWVNAPLTEGEEVSIELTEAGIQVTGSSGNFSVPALLDATLRYMMFGDEHVLVLETLGSIGPITRRVIAVDFSTTPPSGRLVLTGSSSGPDVPPPVIQFSQQDGAVFLAYSSSGTQIQNLAMHESVNGDVIFAGPPPFIATGETRGEATDTELLIHYSSGGVSREVVFQFADLAGGEPFLLPGDSGAVLVDNSRRVLGLLFAGNEEERDDSGAVVVAEGVFAFANPVAAVLDAMEVELCIGSGGGGATIPGGGGGIPGGGVPPSNPWVLSLRNVAADELGVTPTFSVRNDVILSPDALPASLRGRLVQLLTD